MAATAIQKAINKVTGVNRRNVNTNKQRRNVKNAFRKKTSGGMGG